jgi:hypothetical protein
MFAEDLSVFFDEVDGFAIDLTVAGAAAKAIFDAPGAEALGGEVVTSEPSLLLTADVPAAEGDSVVILNAALPAQLLHLAGTYTVRSIMPEPPDGAIVRVFLVKN